MVTWRDKFLQSAMKYAGTLEMFLLPGVSFYLSRQLSRLQKQGAFSTYTMHTKRIGKWHYRIEVELDLTPKQLAYLLHSLQKQLNGFREVI
jgi:hypothetical protein